MTESICRVCTKKGNFEGGDGFLTVYNYYDKEWKVKCYREKDECLECAKEISIARFKKLIINLLSKEKNKIKVNWKFFLNNPYIMPVTESILRKFGIISYQGEKNFEIFGLGINRRRKEIINSREWYFIKLDDALEYVSQTRYSDRFEIHQIDKIFYENKNNFDISDFLEIVIMRYLRDFQ